MHFFLARIAASAARDNSSLMFLVIPLVLMIALTRVRVPEIAGTLAAPAARAARVRCRPRARRRAASRSVNELPGTCDIGLRHEQQPDMRSFRGKPTNALACAGPAVLSVLNAVISCQ